MTRNLISYDAVKKWLYSVRDLCRLRRFYLNEVDGLTLDCKRIREGRASVFHLAHVKNSDIFDPTGDKVIKIIDEYGSRMNSNILAIDRVDMEIAKVKSRLETIFHNSDMTVSEYEVLHYYFFEGMSNNEVAIATFYSVDMIYKLKASAVQKIMAFEG